MRISQMATFVLLSVNTVYAQGDQNNVQLNDVVIIGSKLEKTLQESISSVQVFTDEDILNSSNLTDLYDIFEETSNVLRIGKNNFNIRGINSLGDGGSFIGPKTINISVDGASQNSFASRQGAISTWDVEQVEILKGPQSTTQGRNSLAGAVVVKTKDPEFDTNGAAQVNYGSNSTYQVSLMQTGAVTDNLAFRLSVDQKHSDGFVTNDEIRGDKFNESDITNLRGKFLYKFDNDATILLTLSQLDYDDAGYDEVTQDRKNLWNTDGYYNTKAVSHSLEINYPINSKWSLKSITSYTDEKFDNLSDLDDSDGTSIAKRYRENESINQEFRFNYKTNTSQSVIGLYYSEGEGEDTTYVENLNYSSFLIDYQNYAKEEYTNTAIFFNTDYYLNDNLTLIVGARVDKDTRKSTKIIKGQRVEDLGTAYNTYLDNLLEQLATGSIESENNTHNFLPKIGLNYKLNDNINTGLLYSKGYRPGGMSVNPITGESSSYDTEYTDNYELSFKTLWLNNRLKINTNLFYTIWRNQQVVEYGSSGSSFDINTINAAKSILQGIELDTKYEITKLINIYGNVGFIKAEYDEFNVNDNDYKGNNLIKTPHMTGTIGINYRNNQNYFISSNINYTGSYYQDSANKNKIDPYSIVNLKVGYEEKDWSAYLYANNLFDKDYEISNYGDGTYQMGDGRVVGVNFKYYWE